MLNMSNVNKKQDINIDIILENTTIDESERWYLCNTTWINQINDIYIEFDYNNYVDLEFDNEQQKSTKIPEGIYAGWGLIIEDNILKFKKII